MDTDKQGMTSKQGVLGFLGALSLSAGLVMGVYQLVWCQRLEEPGECIPLLYAPAFLFLVVGLGGAIQVAGQRTSPWLRRGSLFVLVGLSGLLGVQLVGSPHPAVVGLFVVAIVAFALGSIWESSA